MTYWVQSAREVMNGSWERPPAFLFAGLFPAAASTFISAWFYRIDPFVVGDLIAPIAMLGLGIARLGCLNYGCCFGRVCHNSNLGVTYRHPYSFVNRVRPATVRMPRIPVQLFEASGMIILSAPIFYVTFMFNVSALATALFFVACGSLRFFTEFLREAQVSSRLGLTLWQWICLACVALGLFLMTFVSPREANELHAIDPSVAVSTIVPTMILAFLQFSCVFGMHRR
jgi:prolipoprotein diacylglyceryltransferase